LFIYQMNSGSIKWIFKFILNMKKTSKNQLGIFVVSVLVVIASACSNTKKSNISSKGTSQAESLTDYSARGTRDVEKEVARRMEMNLIAKPTKEQLAFHDLELGLFIHFGLKTYTGGSEGASPLSFNPKKLDCEQWMEVAKSMGAKYVVLTARHEGGFCLWPTETTDYSIKSSPWKDGKGDVVREFVNACRKHDMKVGLYHSSWHDSYHTKWQDADYFKKQGPEVQEKFTQMQEQQVTELLTNYGPITYLWFDHHGCPGYGANQFWHRIDKVVKKAQPSCLIFGADVWITGGHQGRAFYPLWYAQNTEDGTRMSRPLNKDKGNPWGKFYRVWEANTCVSGHWFWSGGGLRLSLDTLFSRYYESVGRGANFLPNYAPNPDGLMPPDVVQQAKEFGDTIQELFSRPIAETSGKGQEIVFELEEPVTIKHVVIMEQLADGQKIAKYRIDAMITGTWVEIASGQTVGHKRIHKVKRDKVKMLRFVCLDSLAKTIEIRSLAVY